MLQVLSFTNVLNLSNFQLLGVFSSWKVYTAETARSVSRTQRMLSKYMSPFDVCGVLGKAATFNSSFFGDVFFVFVCLFVFILLITRVLFAGYLKDLKNSYNSY